MIKFVFPQCEDIVRNRAPCMMRVAIVKQLCARKVLSGTDDPTWAGHRGTCGSTTCGCGKLSDSAVSGRGLVVQISLRSEHALGRCAILTEKREASIYADGGTRPAASARSLKSSDIQEDVAAMWSPCCSVMGPRNEMTVRSPTKALRFGALPSSDPLDAPSAAQKSAVKEPATLRG
mmetsp:Transcript_46204/g.104125  ORF Transcript_46204/g.104125 Transcript_46204/m.104125 type:complete len:177 (-) Transcript_46204:242-772(-)